MGQTTKIDGLMAFASRLSDDDREGCRPLKITTIKRTTQSKDNEPQKQFGVTFNTPRNLIQ
jgi:hypothetical protein